MMGAAMQQLHLGTGCLWSPTFWYLMRVLHLEIRTDVPWSGSFSYTFPESRPRKCLASWIFLHPKFLKMESSHHTVTWIMSQVVMSGRRSKGIAYSAFTESVEETLLMLNDDNFKRKAHVAELQWTNLTTQHVQKWCSVLLGHVARASLLSAHREFVTLYVHMNPSVICSVLSTVLQRTLILVKLILMTLGMNWILKQCARISRCCVEGEPFLSMSRYCFPY